MATILSQRSSNLSTFNAIAINYSTLTGSTIASASTIVTSSIIDINITSQSFITSTLSLNSTMVSLGQSTNQTYTTLAKGAVSTVGNWTTSLASLVSTKTVSMSANAQYQLAITQVSTATSVQYTSTLGTNWSTISNVSGLPTATQTNYAAGAISGSGQYQLVAAYGGYPYLSNNYGATFANVNTTTGTVPNYYFPFDNSIVDVQQNTTLTAYGTVGYTTGPTGTGALSLSNTAGGAPNNYISGPISINNNCTISFMFNLLTLPTTNDTSAYIVTFSSGTTNLSNQLTCLYLNLAGYTGFYVQFMNSSNSHTSILGGYTITANTWYNIRVVFQGGSTSYVYINNVQVASAVTTTMYLPSTKIIIGGNSALSSNSALNGYIDELRIWNTNTPLLPPLYTPYIYLPFEGTVTDSKGNSTVTATGSPGYVSGIVGTNAIYINNTAGGTPSQYVRGTWTGSTYMSVSLWFNIQATAASSNQTIFSSYQSNLWIALNSSNQLMVTVPTGGGASYVYLTLTNSTISLNIWYNIALIFQTNGLCSCYLNNTLIGSYTNTQGTGTLTTTIFSIGSYDNQLVGALNGYIDDLIIYNSAITFTPMIPMNYNNAALSASGQYMLLSSPTGLFMSSNYGTTWSQATGVSVNTSVQNAAISASGQYMLSTYGKTAAPQSASANATSWTTNDIRWVATSSSNYNTNYPPYVAFNNIYTGATLPYSWASSGGYISGGASAISLATTSFTTSIIFAGTSYFNGVTQTITGNYLQIQSSTALIMYNYNFSCGYRNQIPHTYYIVGSNDTTNWYPIQYATANTTYIAPGTVGSTYISPFASPTVYDNAGPTSNLLVNYTGIQTISYLANTVINVSTTAFPTTTTSFIYYRIVIMALYANSENAEIEEWGINFVSGQSYSTNYGASWSNTTQITTPNCLAISGSGQYAIGANTQTAYIVSNYLAGFSTNTSTNPTLTSINANIVGAALSNTGQYMVIVTAGTTNNLYYSSNYGATFTGLTLGSTALTSCAISYDGSYITVANATTIYTLNNNSNGYSVAIGSQAGASNQMQNAIAIGTQAGYVNQEQSSIAIGAYAGQNFQAANSIVLNASGQALNAYYPGFYVAPIATYNATTSLLAYGTDNQITQANAITLLSSGYVGIGTTNPTSVLQVVGNIAGTMKTFDIPHPLSAGKRLVHSAIEGPRCDLIYRGTTMLNNGTATVYIDTQCTYDPQCSMDQGTFVALCTNPQCLLQNMTGFDAVNATIQGTVLTITSQNPSSMDMIYWMIIAERKDSFIKQWDRTDANGYLITQYST